MNPTNYLTIGDVARFLKCTDRTVYNHIKFRGLPSVKVGGSTHIKEPDFKKWLKKEEKKSK